MKETSRISWTAAGEDNIQIDIDQVANDNRFNNKQQILVFLLFLEFYVLRSLASTKISFF